MNWKLFFVNGKNKNVKFMKKKRDFWFFFWKNPNENLFFFFFVRRKFCLFLSILNGGKGFMIDGGRVFSLSVFFVF